MARVCVIEINDAGLVAADDGGVRLVSPGYAVIDDGSIALGTEAFAQMRLNPRRGFDRFWNQLDQQPLARPTQAAHSHADLAYYHLRALWDEVREGVTEVVLVAPATFDKAQLSLLLGIGRACEMPVTGLVEASLAAAASLAGNQPYLHLDAQLHRLVAARIDGGNGLAWRGTEELARHGLAALHDVWAELIAECFLRQTRFNPLHRAQTEQMLYDRLAEWLAVLRARPRARLELPVGSRTHRVDLSQAELVEAAADFYRPLAEAAASEKVAVLLSHRLGTLPGLVETIAARAGAPPVVLAPDAPARTVLAFHEFVRSEDAALAFVTRLPGAARDVAPAPALSEGRPEACPTHVLHRWRAYPIPGTPLVLEPGAPRAAHPDEAPHACSVVLCGGVALLRVPEASAAVELNGRAVSGEVGLAVGDRLRVGEEEMRFIAEVAARGP